MYVYLWPDGGSLWRSFGAYQDSFAFSQLSHFFFCGFSSEQLLNGHSSLETGHWEAQKGLPGFLHCQTHTYTWQQRQHTHTEHTPGKARFSYGSQSEMWQFSRCFPSWKWLWRLSTLFNLTTMENKAWCYIVADVTTTERNPYPQCRKNNTVVALKGIFSVHVNSKHHTGVTTCSKQLIVGIMPILYTTKITDIWSFQTMDEWTEQWREQRGFVKLI